MLKVKNPHEAVEKTRIGRKALVDFIRGDYGVFRLANYIESSKTNFKSGRRDNAAPQRAVGFPLKMVR